MPSPLVGVGADGSKAVDELLAAVNAEFERLRAENGALARELQALRGGPCSNHGASAGPDSCGPGPSAGGSERAPAAAVARPIDKASGDGQEASLLMLQSEGRDSEDGSESKANVRRARNSGFEAEGLGSASVASIRDILRGDSQRLEAEERYENFYDLMRAFNMLSELGPFQQKATIGIDAVAKMHDCQEGLDGDNSLEADTADRFKIAVKELNKALGVFSRDDQPAEDITRETYFAIMQEKEGKLQQLQGKEDVQEVIAEIRDILVKEDAIRKVARATNMDHEELYTPPARHFKPESRMTKITKYIDLFIGLVILLNALVIGLSTDIAQDSPLWVGMECTFTLIFLLEIVFKLSKDGWRLHFLGIDMGWNIFDAAVVLIAIVDLVFSILGSLLDLRHFTIMRLLRFARLTKLVRVLKLKIFKELTLLINGCFAGFRTLFWAIIALFFLLYFLGVLLTQMIGKEDKKELEDLCDEAKPPQCAESVAHILQYRQELFGSVLRSSFTTFRCFTDGCSSIDGTPLMPYFYNAYGLQVIALYMVCIMFVIFGLFNLIMAVFVENTIENARHDDARRREARTSESIRVARKLQEVIIMFCTGQNVSESDVAMARVEQRVKHPGRWVWSFFRKSSVAAGNTARDVFHEHPELDNAAFKPANLRLKVTHDAFYAMLKRPEVTDLLDDLEVGMHCRNTLFDVLDANCNGVLEVSELVQGLLRLRGAAEKGDIIASLLAIRSIQKSIKAVELLGLQQQGSIESLRVAQERMEANLQQLAGERGSPLRHTFSSGVLALHNGMTKETSRSSL